MRDSWRKLTIGNEINLLNGFPFNSSFFNENKDGTPLIRIRDLLTSSQKTYYKGVFSDTYLVEEDEILVGMDGDFHLIRWKNSPSLLNQRILKIGQKKDSRISTDFLFYYLKPFLLEIHAKTAATTVKHLSSYDILNAIEYFPPLPQQQKIAQILSTCDTVLEKTEAAIAKYKAIKQRLLHDLFTRGIDLATGKLRPCYEEAPELYIETELGFVPREWVVEKLGEFIEAIDPQPSHRTPPELPNGVPYLGINDIKNGEIQFSKCRKVSPEVLNEHLNRYSISNGDIIFGKIGTIGEPKRLVAPQDYTLSANVILIKPSKSKDLIFHYLNSRIVDSQILRKIHTTSQPAFGIEKIRSLLIPDIPIEEAKNLENKFNSIEQKIESEQRSLEKYRAVKAGLMQDLLSGAVGVEGLLKKEENPPI